MPIGSYALAFEGGATLGLFACYLAFCRCSLEMRCLKVVFDERGAGCAGRGVDCKVMGGGVWRWRRISYRSRASKCSSSCISRSSSSSSAWVR